MSILYLSVCTLQSLRVTILSIDVTFMMKVDTVHEGNSARAHSINITLRYWRTNVNDKNTHTERDMDIPQVFLLRASECRRLCTLTISHRFFLISSFTYMTKKISKGIASPETWLELWCTHLPILGLITSDIQIRDWKALNLLFNYGIIYS